MVGLNISTVAVVDDDVADAGPLMNVLSMNGVSVQYYDGTYDGLPSSPHGGIRVLFLDLHLGAGSEVPKTRKSKLSGILTKLIGPENGPYLLVAWTGHADDYGELVEVLDNANGEFARPVACVPIKKIQAKTKDQYNLAKIKHLVFSQIAKHPPLEFLMSWEKFSIDGVKRSVSQLTMEYGASDENLRCLVKELAISQIGDNSSGQKLARSAVFVLNKILLDELDGNAGKDKFYLKNVSKPCVKENKVDKKNKEILNQKLNVRLNSGGSVPGNVYGIQLINIQQAKDDSQDGHLEPENKKNKSIIRTSRKILVEVSPLCDFAQGNIKLHRFIPGYIFLTDGSKPYFKNPGRTEHIYLTGPLRYDSKSAWISLNFRFLLTLKESYLKKLGRPIFTLREAMLSEIQHKLANHVSRIGVDGLR